MGCGCVLALLAGASPRLALGLVWLLTNLVHRAFHGIVLPLLGLVFVPFGTLMYVLTYRPGHGVPGWGWALVVLGFALDLGNYGAGARARERSR
ncbi:hypothetical protein [Kitasatospora viridis]|uniref:Uncharacterized protein n=1 Tax=Kitasatospora viridis TaxID=281105 RepID=A0A561TW90_9ACTN|nr:hypothetical protein [Kitasatospora viridis]TWF91372.1 hypothetical protein FHX73_12487 [Kitasatospora viridis]